MHFLCLEPRVTDKSVMKFSTNLVLKFNSWLLGALFLSYKTFLQHHGNVLS